MAPNGGADAVRVVDLVKRYPKRDANAVDGLTFSVPRGEVFGLLGPNGAGKTTTIGILTTRLKATSGHAQVDGVDVLRDAVAARSRLAVVPQQPNLDRALTPRQNLTFHAAYHGVARAERNARAVDLIEEFGLTGQADIKVDWYSGGMAQRLMIARALIHEPAVLFLDEPTTGLDPQARLFVWDRIREMRKRNVTIVLTTHDMDEANELCDRVGIVDQGRLLALDSPATLTRGLTAQSILDLTVLPGRDDDATSLLSALKAVDGVKKAEILGAGDALSGAPGPVAAAAGEMAPHASADAAVAVAGPGPTQLRLYLHGEPAPRIGPVATVLSGRSAVLTDVHIGQPSLEDVFIELTGRGLR